MMLSEPFELIRPLWAGLVLSLMTTLFGFGMGISFGVAEDALKHRLTQSAMNAGADVYAGDAAKMKAVTDKAWVYYKRAHLHAGGLGVQALSMTLLLALLSGVPRWARALTAILLGGGALGYSLFWLAAGDLAPRLGSTGAAKDALRWLAWPSSGALVIGTLSVLGMLLGQLVIYGRQKRG